MVVGEVKRTKHVPVVLHLRPFGNRKAQAREYADNLLAHKRQRVACANLCRSCGAGKVDGCIGSVIRGESLAQSVDFVGGESLELIELLTDFALLLIGHIAEVIEKG